MKLLVDMGNSRMKWATVSNGVLSQASVLEYDELPVMLKGTWRQLAKPEQILVSCVSTNEHWLALEQVAHALWGATAERVFSSQQAHGVENSYTEAATLGSDRWAALVAAHQLYSGTVCIVDCGTALTVDGLSAQGQHLGGVIVPGVQMMQSSLVSNTAAISLDKATQQDTLSKSLLACDTGTAIVNGSWLACAGVVEKIHSSLCVKENDKVTCILTGGNAEQLATKLSNESVVDTELVLKGLAIIAGEKIIK